MDYYLEDSERLNGQPKRTIADYVESQGIKVPRRFDSLSEARKSHRPILLRSEHPLEYGGFSGLLDSVEIRYERGIQSVDELKEIIRTSKTLWFPGDKHRNYPGYRMFRNYCNLLGLDIAEEWSKVSYSFWEREHGLNRTIVADSSIKGRYHIFDFFSHGSFDSGDSAFAFRNYIFENGKVILRMDRKCNSDFPEGLEEVVEFYESIRNLPNFDPNNCPLMELQFVNGEHKFLQYKRGRDFNEVNFEIDGNLNGKKEAQFVRGHTPKEGIQGSVILYYPWQGNDEMEIYDEEFGSFDTHFNYAFSNIMYPRRKVQLIHMSHPDFEFEMMKYVIAHSQKSRLTLPEVSLIIDPIFPHRRFEDLEKSEVAELYQKARETGIPQGIDFHIVSDGRRALYERV